jgi:type 1 glutamine amidotransferase
MYLGWRRASVRDEVRYSRIGHRWPQFRDSETTFVVEEAFRCSAHDETRIRHSSSIDREDRLRSHDNPG